MAGRREEIHDETQRRALRDIERLDEQSEVIGTSQFRRSANRARDHFMGADNVPDEKIEIWGKRIGRVLSLIFVVALVIYLVQTYS